MDIVFEEYPRIIRNRVNPGMGVRMLGELVLEKISEERCSVESRGEVECYWFFRGKIERDIRHAHTTMLQNLKKVLENENKLKKEIIASNAVKVVNNFLCLNDFLFQTIIFIDSSAYLHFDMELTFLLN